MKKFSILFLLVSMVTFNVNADEGYKICGKEVEPPLIQDFRLSNRNNQYVILGERIQLLVDKDSYAISCAFETNSNGSALSIAQLVVDDKGKVWSATIISNVK